MRTTYSSILILSLALGSLGCDQGGALLRGQVAQEQASEPGPSYPPGRWRLAPRAELDRVVLWVSHIAIMHTETNPAASVLRPPGWVPDRRSTRTRAEAAKLARELAREAAHAPERFAELAAKSSDDVVTRAQGGSLGGVRASQLPSEFLDALAVLRPGQVSEVVTTPFGYHVLLRRAPPPAERITGSRIVIRYRGTISDAEEQDVQRSRQEALTLAEAVVREARSGTPFEALVARYSDSADRAFMGAIGSWSTTAPDDRPREVEALARLAPEAISEPVDSFWGFQIMKRSPSSEPLRYAMAAARFGLDPSRVSDPAHVATVAAEARAFAARAQHDAGALVEWARTHDAPAVERWEFGHNTPALSAALAQLTVGQVATEPVRVPYYFVVPMRLDPELSGQEPAVCFELPTPWMADLEAIVRGNESEPLVMALGQLRAVLAELGLDQRERTIAERTLTRFGSELGSAKTPDARARAMHATLRALYTEVPEASYARIRLVIEHAATTLMMKDAV